MVRCFKILDAEGNLVMEWESKREPMTITGLPHGDYILHEVQAPKGYLLAEDVKFAVTDNPEDLNVTLVDEFDPELGGLPQTGLE